MKVKNIKKADLIKKPLTMIGEEIERYRESASDQIFGSVDEENPVLEAMQQKTEESETTKEEDKKRRKFITDRETLDAELKKQQELEENKMKEWSKGVEEHLKIINPGDKMQKEDIIPLTSKQKRGMMPGAPGTAKGGSGMEVVKSKQ